MDGQREKTEALEQQLRESAEKLGLQASRLVDFSTFQEQNAQLKRELADSRQASTNFGSQLQAMQDSKRSLAEDLMAISEELS